MARPIKDNADYFSHDTSMRDDPKIKALRRKFKHEGYSVWNMLLESITDSDNFRLKNDLDIMAGDYDIEPEKLQEIISYCLTLGLLQLDVSSNHIYCKTLQKRLEPLLSKRKRNRNPEDDELSTSENPHSKVKESKAFDLIGTGETSVIVKSPYPKTKHLKIYDLEKYFERTEQLKDLKFKGWIHFGAFMAENPGKMFNDENHLYNTFKDFSSKYQPPARAPNKFQKAEENKGLWTVEAWEDFYRKQLNTNPEFRKHFGYGELQFSMSVGSEHKN